MIKYLFSGLFIVFFAFNIFSQVNDAKIRSETLQKNVIGEVFTFKNRDGSRTDLCFLGIIKTETGKKYKVVTSRWLWGLELHRATKRILLFNEKNEYLGNYLVNELPYKLDDNKIFIEVKDSHCKDSTVIDFRKGIPYHIFINCDQGGVFEQ